MGNGRSKSTPAYYEGLTDTDSITRDDLAPYNDMVTEEYYPFEPRQINPYYKYVRGGQLKDIPLTSGESATEKDLENIIHELGFNYSYSEIQSKIDSNFIKYLTDATGPEASSFSTLDPNQQRGMMTALDSAYRMTQLTGIKPELIKLYKGLEDGDMLAISTPKIMFKSGKTPLLAKSSPYSPEVLGISYPGLLTAGAGGWAVSTTVRSFTQSAIVHEYGHLYLSKLLQQKSTRNRVMEYADKTKSMKTLSLYGNVDHNEAFAENFTAFVMGVKTPAQGAKQYKEFQTLMKDVGGESLYNSFKTAPNALDKITNYNQPTKPKVAKPAPKPAPAPKPSAPSPARTITATVGGKSLSIDFSDSMLNRGFAIKNVGGKVYVVYLDGRVVEVNL